MNEYIGSAFAYMFITFIINYKNIKILNLISSGNHDRNFL